MLSPNFKLFIVCNNQLIMYNCTTNQNCFKEKKMFASLPYELLTETFKYIDDKDYSTLYSCILVNKQWHIINIPTLWKKPFHSIDTTKIIINCLLQEKEK